MRALLLCAAVAVLAGCQATGSGVIAEHTPTERVVLGATLEERLLKVRPQQPIFATSRQLAPDELSVLVAFVRTVPSGRLIEAGNPIYFIDIKSKIERYSKNHIHLVYDVAVLRADTKTIILRSSLASNCVEVEALYTYPIRCSLLRPILLRRTLEGL